MKNCVICNKELQGNQRRFCCNDCKSKQRKTNRNTYHRQTIKGMSRKLMFVDELGGGCSICGYSENISALHFHHTDPSKKSFALDQRILSNLTLDRLKEEVKKCIVLCGNCHAETHYPECNTNIVRDTISSSDSAKLILAPKTPKVKVYKEKWVSPRKFNPTKEELNKLIWEDKMPYRHIGALYGVSDNAVKKRCKVLEIPIRRIKKLP